MEMKEESDDCHEYGREEYRSRNIGVERESNTYWSSLEEHCDAEEGEVKPPLAVFICTDKEFDESPEEEEEKDPLSLSDEEVCSASVISWKRREGFLSPGEHEGACVPVDRPAAALPSGDATERREAAAGSSWACPVCKKLFSRKRYMRVHVRNAHMRPVSTQTLYLRKHVREERYKCPLCPRSYRYKKNLEVHQSNHTSEKSFKCSECLRTFFRKSALVIHMRIHSEQNVFTCPKCMCKFSHKGNLTVHMRFHTGERPFR